MLPSSYNSTLVVISLLVAILASYTALDMAGRVNSNKGRLSLLWLLGGSFAMGFGIWSMHFIGMLAFSLPIPLGYDLGLTVYSLLIAIASSCFALWLSCRKELLWWRLAGGALLMGSGIASMHYLGMAAMRMQPGIVYDTFYFSLSILIAVLASGAALFLAFQLRRSTRHIILIRMLAASVMGVAIVGMHYTGMLGAGFPLGSFCGAANTGIDTDWLSVVVIVITLAVLSIALILSMLDARTSILARSLAKANNELVHFALHDNLTKLPNRIILDDRLSHALHKATDRNQSFAVLFMDLDGFKAVNDAYGHYTGDKLLVQVAERIQQTMRPEDTAARLGGDEFVLLLDPCTPDDASSIAQQLIDQLSTPYTVDEHILHVSASIGIALYPTDGNNEHDLMVNADTAMYHAKEQGKNGFRFFESALNTNAHHQRQLLQDLRKAIDAGEFVLHYQPKFIAPSGPVTGVEALLRWQHPERGLIPPDHFLPLAEKTGLIVPIGSWVLNEACGQLQRWRNEQGKDWTVSVNLSALQLIHPKLLDTIQSALSKHQLPPEKLTLEITETTAMQDAETSLIILEKITALGVNISIDDFGTGYSSLLYLKRLPAKELKIDRGFITELAENTDDAAIVSAIVALGKTLNLKTVAEGVETSEQSELLTRIGCHTLQGYLLGKPVPPEELIDQLRENGAVPVDFTAYRNQS